MSVRATPRVERGGIILSERVWALVEDAQRAAAVFPRVVQGSWHAGSLSGGTHAGGGAFDLGTAHLPEESALAQLYQLRRRGVAAWLRSPEYGWTSSGDHIHGIVRDEPGLSKAAAAQVRAYDLGLNGLASKRPDPFTRVEWTPFRMFGKPAAWPGHRLSLGAAGPAVVSLQRALELTPDGSFGPVTQGAVKRFQRTRPALWPADGVVGPKSYAAIIEWGWR